MLLLYSALRPGGMIRQPIETWRQRRASQQQVTRHWKDLTGVGGHLDDGVDQVALVEFSDYQCPFCRRAAASIDSLLAANPSIGMVYRHFPLPIHAAAPGAARASICAEEQGRFRELHHQLFRTERWQSDTNWLREAEEAHVPDLQRFRVCLSSERTSERLAADVKLGQTLGINGTPTILGGRGFLRGVQSASDLMLLIGRDE